MHINPLNSIDFYKAAHIDQYPDNTTMIYSNFTPRSSKHSNLPHTNERIVFFGLQYYIMSFLLETWDSEFFAKDKEEVVAEYRRRMDTSLGMYVVDTKHIAALHDLGYLPIEIKAVPEGTEVSMKVPCLTIHNTHPDFAWLVNYLESSLSCYLWKACTSATTARWYRRLMDKYAAKTGTDLDTVDFQAHDFSFRGMASIMDASLSGAAHLTSFKGTDTVAAIDLLEDYYLADAKENMMGGSVAATEHSVMSAYGEEYEMSVFRRLLSEVYPEGIVSIVSDTYDYWRLLTEYLPMMKHYVMARHNGKLVIRPDSGDPVKIICGDPDAPIGSPEYKGSVAVLWDIFGGHQTETGHRMLDPRIGLIYGDSITPERAEEILEKLHLKGYASGNIVLGIGSYTYQHVTRDTYGFAVKATAAEIEGEMVELFKDPKTDDGTKKSARGLLRVFDGKLQDQQATIEGGDLETIFKNGVLSRVQSLEEIRERLKEK